MNERDQSLVLDMLAFAHRVRYRVEGKSRENLEEDLEPLRGLIVRELAVIGEAANHLSPEFAAEHPEVALPQVIGLRKRIVHGYLRIDWDVIWEISTRNIPELIVQPEAIASTKSGPSNG